MDQQRRLDHFVSWMSLFSIRVSSERPWLKVSPLRLTVHIAQYVLYVHINQSQMFLIRLTMNEQYDIWAVD